MLSSFFCVEGCNGMIREEKKEIVSLLVLFVKGAILERCTCTGLNKKILDFFSAVCGIFFSF